MATWLAGRPAILIAGDWRPDGKGPHDDVEVRVAYNIFHIPAIAWWIDSVTLTQLRVTVVDDGVLIMLKGTRGKRKLVSWFKAATWRDAFTLVATSIDCGYADWLDDKPPPRRKA